ncbi:hypothetical protein TNCV_2559811 [Trichonephila clavipes]|nr:hypothetical protein TNCV_2559811 [Trichonephila clavipes]
MQTVISERFLQLRKQIEVTRTHARLIDSYPRLINDNYALQKCASFIAVFLQVDAYRYRFCTSVSCCGTQRVEIFLMFRHLFIMCNTIRGLRVTFKDNFRTVHRRSME